MSVVERAPRAVPRAARWHAALAALLYLGAALWAVRVILPAPASTFPHPEYLDWIWCAGCPREVIGLIVENDQKHTAAQVARSFP